MASVGRTSAACAVALIAAALSSVACQSTSTCDRTPDFAEVDDGRVYGNTYISALNEGDFTGPTSGPWAYFPPARTVTFKHGLGATPTQWAVWVAFQPHGVLAPSAGNISILEFVDDQYIKFKNDTCSEFYAWVQASTPAVAGTLGASGVPDQTTWPIVSSLGEAGASGDDASGGASGASGASGAQ